MRDQRGFTVVEMVAVLALIALLAVLAGLGGVAFVNSSKISKSAARFADSVSLAREQAIGRYEQWRISFPTPPAGSDVVSEYYLESCQVAPPSTTCASGWTRRSTVQLDTGAGLSVPLSGGIPLSLEFDRTGRFLGATMEIGVCHAAQEGGMLICRSGSVGRLIRIRGFSGIIET